MLQIRSLTDLAIAVDHMLGFRPTDSLLIVPLGSAGGTRPVVRVDMPHDITDLDNTNALQVHRDNPGPVVVLTYTHDRAHARRITHQVTAALGETVPVTIAAWIHQTPAAGEGATITDLNTGQSHTITNSDRTRMAAETALHGMTPPAPSREYRAQSLTGADPAPVRAHLDAASDRIADALAEQVMHDALGGLTGHNTGAAPGAVAVEVAWTRRTLTDALTEHGPARLDDATVARLLTVLHIKNARDAAGFHLLTVENAATYRDLWADIVRRAPAEARDYAACVLALAAWLSGDGALAWMSLDLVEHQDLSLATLVAQTLKSGGHPATLWKHIQEAIQRS